VNAEAATAKRQRPRGQGFCRRAGRRWGGVALSFSVIVRSRHAFAWSEPYLSLIRLARPNHEEPMPDRLERRCQEIGLKMTDQRRVIARVLSAAKDHPDVEQLYQRATKVDPRISIATVYRTVKLFEESGILERHDFGDGRARYEQASDDHHDHLIDVKSGEVIEFQNEEIERLQREIARTLGYELVDHRLELYAKKIEK
jgi:Fur family ferric uptake transcriptional regulator